MKSCKAIILMGSRSDMPHAEKIAEKLDRFGVPYVFRIGSAHKVPLYVLDIIHEAENESQDIVFITIAGLSNALSGMVDWATRFPVIACPPPPAAFAGSDIFSSLQMPPGVAPAVILDPLNAALFAAKILSFSSPDIALAIRSYREEQQAKLLNDDAETRQKRNGSN